jgi:translation initiation factor 1
MKSAKSRAGGLVYSTELGRTCPTCRQALADCRCGRPVIAPAPGGIRVLRDSKGRGGKVVTVVQGLPLAADALAALAKELKVACGVGGTCRDGLIEIQGEHLARVRELLLARGWKVRP